MTNDACTQNTTAKVDKTDITDKTGKYTAAAKRGRAARVFIAFAAVCLPVMLLFYSDWLRASVIGSLELCAGTVIPALFPFIIANEFFTYSGAAQTLGKPLGRLARLCFGMGGATASAVLTGLVCGYPAGAACAFGLFALGECSADEAERCAAFSSNAGPAFVIGGIGGAMLGDAKLGIIIWCSTVMVSLVSGFFLRFTAKKAVVASSGKQSEPLRREFSLSGMIADSAAVMLKICAYIVAFSAAADAAGALCDSLGLGNTAGALLRGIFELTTAADYAALTLPPKAAAVAIAAIVGWSGLCVHMQTAALCPQELSLRRYYIVKLLSAPASAAFCAALIIIAGI
jgi:hypothetical protein